MTSRLQRRLDAALAAATSPVEQACLGAERAVLLARRGHLQEARSGLEQARYHYGRGVHPAVTAWWCLAEGLLDHFADPSVAAHDRIQRAHALAGAAQLASLHALAGAWLAHAHSVQNEPAQMARRLAEVFKTAAPDHHGARARACLVAGRAYHFAGQPEAARGFYTRAREHASAEGDDATVSAILCDMACHGVQQAQWADLFEGGVGANARQALLGVESWQHFDHGTGAPARAPVVATLRAQALMVQGQFDAALALFEQHLPAALTQGQARREATLRADQAWCLYRQARGDDALASARDAEAALSKAGDVTDRALAHARLAAVFQALGLRTVAEAHQAQAQEHRRQWQDRRTEIVRLLDVALGGATLGAGVTSGTALPST